VLVDLRMHGRSQDAPPPHTVAAAAGDLAALAADLAARGAQVRAVCGHSFGGKVALAYRAAAPPSLLATWVVDSDPAARPDATSDAGADPLRVRAILDALAALPLEIENRSAFEAALGERGLSAQVTAWLAMNLEPAGAGGRQRLRLDLAAIRALLADHDRRDAWPELESPDLPGRVGVLLGGASQAVSPASRARLGADAEAGRIDLEVIDGAGHWVHAERPAEVVAVLAARLPRLV
jgi:pimeloyl-ACP methyl ester carboxylesterase